MGELVRCQCGAEAALVADFATRAPARCQISCLANCGARVVVALANDALAYEKVAERWNALMRPRPVAEWREAEEDWFVLFLQNLRIGSCYKEHEGCWLAHYSPSGDEEFHTDLPSARAWLEGRVRDLGFDIRET